jgi:hypothetical protein
MTTEFKQINPWTLTFKRAEPRNRKTRVQKHPNASDKEITKIQFNTCTRALHRKNVKHVKIFGKEGRQTRMKLAYKFELKSRVHSYLDYSVQCLYSYL